MRFFIVCPGQATQFYDGEFAAPYPDLGRLILTAWVPPQQLRVQVVRGGRLGDMLFAAFNVVSPRFVDVLRANQATGFGTAEVVLMKGDEILATYYVLKLSGRGGPFDPVRSHARYGPDGPSGAIFDYDGIYMNESNWDGSDVFAIPGLGIGIYVVERIAEAIRKAKLKNVVLTPSEECSMIPRKLKSKLEATAAERTRAPKPIAHDVPAPARSGSRFPPGFDLGVFAQKLADSRAVLARIDEGAALPADESEAARFTASLFEDLTENMAMQDRMLGRQADCARISTLLRSVPTLIDLLRRCMAERPVSAPRVLAAAYRLSRTAADYVPPYSVAWAKLLAMCQGLIEHCKDRGHSEADIELMIQEQARNLPIPDELK